MAERERELIRFAHAEVDAIGIVQRTARHTLAVHPGAVTAVQIFNLICAIFQKNARVITRGSVVAKNQVIVGVAADEKRKLIDLLPRPAAGGMQNDQGRGGSVSREFARCRHSINEVIRIIATSLDVSAARPKNEVRRWV